MKEIARKRKTYLNPCILVVLLAQFVYQRGASSASDAILLHDLKDLLPLICWSRLDFLKLSLLLIQVMVSLCDSSKICTQTHGDSTGEKLSQATNDDQLRGTKTVVICQLLFS